MVGRDKGFCGVDDGGVVHRVSDGGLGLSGEESVASVAVRTVMGVSWVSDGNL